MSFFPVVFLTLKCTVSIPSQTLFGFLKTLLIGVSEDYLEHERLRDGIHCAPRNLHLAAQVLPKPKITLSIVTTVKFKLSERKCISIIGKHCNNLLNGLFYLRSAALLVWYETIAS